MRSARISTECSSTCLRDQISCLLHYCHWCAHAHCSYTPSTNCQLKTNSECNHIIVWIYHMHYRVALFPAPPSFLSVAVCKSGRGPGIFSHISDRKDGRKGVIVHGRTGPRTANKPIYQVTYHTYLASGRRLPYTPSINHVVGWYYAKHSLFCRFSPFSNYVMLTWEKIPGSPHFSTVQVMESWAGPGNKAITGCN